MTTKGKQRRGAEGRGLPSEPNPSRAPEQDAPATTRTRSKDAPATSYFLPYQQRWITDDAALKLYEKSRRVGITYATSYRSVRKCMTRRNFTQWVSSKDMLTAREFVTDYVAKWARALDCVATGLEGVPEVVGEGNIQAYSVRFGATNSRIVSLSSTPQAFAGKGGDVLLDELDLHAEPGVLFDMALPCTTWGGQLEAVSAYDPDGSPSSVFATLVRDVKTGGNPMGWSLHRTTILDAVAEGFVDKLNEVTGQNLEADEWVESLRRRCRTESAWRSQYLCEPQDDGGALLPYALIRACELDGAMRGFDAEPAGARYVGVDIGHKHDLTVMWGLEQVGDVLDTLGIVTLRGVPFRDQLAELIELVNRIGARRVCGDATGIGAMLMEEAGIELRRQGVSVEAVQFTSAVQEDLALRLMRTFEDRQVRVPAEAEVREDLHKIQKVATAAGHVRYAAARDDAGHADRFWALALALLAADSPVVGPVRYEGATHLRSTRESERRLARLMGNPERPDHSDDEPRCSFRREVCCG